MCRCLNQWLWQDNHIRYTCRKITRQIMYTRTSLVPLHSILNFAYHGKNCILFYHYSPYSSSVRSSVTSRRWLYRGVVEEITVTSSGVDYYNGHLWLGAVPHGLMAFPHSETYAPTLPKWKVVVFEGRLRQMSVMEEHGSSCLGTKVFLQ